ncbi:MAG: hypothetical protein JO316_08420 [Abitibacteriaceae bacterium]|nr:hypothetical protein [Abditibacteriaceae bacterium]MBV9865359.1 hypothetical protein [Abditibacteriaceae bacterium]
MRKSCRPYANRCLLVWRWPGSPVRAHSNLRLHDFQDAPQAVVRAMSKTLWTGMRGSYTKYLLIIPAENPVAMPTLLEWCLDMMVALCSSEGLLL